MDKLWDVSQQIGARRKRLGLSLSQLARRANTSPATLSRYENGWSRFEVSTLRKLATALDCDLVVKLQPRPRWVEQPTAEHAVQQLGRLFWDRDLTTSDIEEHALWVIERVLARQVKVLSFADSLGGQLLFSEQQAAQKLGLTTTALKEERLKGRINYLKRGRQVKYLPQHLTEYVNGWIKASDDS